jgi:hypothetical protein
MNFYNVMRWVFEASAEEQLALSELLQWRRKWPMSEPVLPVNMTLHMGGGNDARFRSAPKYLAEQIAEAEQGTAPASAGKPRPILKPGKYKMRLAKVEVHTPTPPARLYAPKSAFSKRWWMRLQRTSRPMTPQQLAEAAGAPKRAKEVSTQLGTIYRRGIVDRARLAGSTAFLYSIKETLP